MPQNADHLVMTAHRSTHHDPLASISDAQHGLITAAQARHLLGSTSAAIALPNSDGWERVTRTLFRRTASPVTFSQRCLAAVLELGGDTVVSHRCALELFSPPEFDRHDTTVHVASTTTRRRRDTLAVIHRVVSLPDRWRTIHRGIPVCAPPLVALQLFALEPSDRATAGVDAMMNAGLVDLRSLNDVVDDLGERGRTGTGALRDYVERRTRRAA